MSRTMQLQEEADSVRMQIKACKKDVESNENDYFNLYKKFNQLRKNKDAITTEKMEVDACFH